MSMINLYYLKLLFIENLPTLNMKTIFLYLNVIVTAENKSRYGHMRAYGGPHMNALLYFSKRICASIINQIN